MSYKWFSSAQSKLEELVKELDIPSHIFVEEVERQVKLRQDKHKREWGCMSHYHECVTDEDVFKAKAYLTKVEDWSTEHRAE